jgi:hypothetical protein
MIKFLKAFTESITNGVRNASNNREKTRDLSMKTILIMLAALPLLAADGARFAGRVFDNHGASQVADAIVTVSTPAGFVSSVTTNKNGEFSFSNLPEGEYNFRVTARDFAIYERAVTVANDFGVKHLDIRLVVPKDKQTVSVAELRESAVPVSFAGETSSSRRGY